MDVQKRKLIEQMHHYPQQLVLVTAGAGTQALSDLLSVAGASNSLLEAIIPYSSAAFDDFLGVPPRQYVHPRTAKLLAGRALTRAHWLAPQVDDVIGIACTATIATNRPKRGEHRAHIAIWTKSCMAHESLYLEKGARNRLEEEQLVSAFILNALARAFRLDALQLPVALSPADSYELTTFDFAEHAHQIHQGSLPYFGVRAHGLIVKRNISPQALIPGSFNPLHEGHLDLAKTAASILEQPVSFEISAFNVDKPPLPPETVTQRLSQFAGRWPVYVTNAPTFVQKARLFPGATFIVGFDTAVRILHPRYYNHSQEEMLAALTEIKTHGCHFLVAGRIDKAGIFHGFQDLDVPNSVADLFSGIPADQFRKDVSSTELRATGQKGSR